MLADVLSERGDPRGELIVVQCELARLPRHDPRRHDLRARERDLLHAHAAAWLPSPRYRLHRGFPERASVPAGGSVDELDEPMLRDLELRRFGGVYHLASLPVAARLATLRLVNPTSAAMSALGDVSLPALRELSIQTVFEDDEPPLVNTKYLVKTLAAMAPLTRLALGGGAFEEPGLRVVAAAALPALVSLALSDEDFTPRDVAALARTAAWENLGELVLARCRLGDDGAEALARLAPPRLERLVVDGNGIGPRGARALAGLRVRELRVSGNPLGDAGLAALCEGLDELRILGAAETQAGAAGVAALGRAPFFRGLVELDLGENPMGERGGRELPAPPSLVALRLAGTGLGDAFVTLVAGRLPSLRCLDVAACGLDAPALEALAGRQLHELRLADNELGDDGVAAIAGLGVQVLDLANTGLGERGLRRLLGDARFAGLRALEVGRNRLTAALTDEVRARFRA